MDSSSSKNFVVVLLLLLLFAGGGFYAGSNFQGLDRSSPGNSIDELRTTIEEFTGENERLQSELAEKTRQLRKQENETQELVQELKQKLEKSRVSSEEGFVTVSMPGRVLFDEASAELSRKNLEELRAVSEALKEQPNREIRVRGHTDTKPVHPDAVFESNWELSAHRAVNVLKYLVYGQGVDRTRIGAVSFGRFRPLAGGRSGDRQAKNRRVEIVLYPESFEVNP